ncbi:3-carboxy-cis cis-mucoante lactonizing enzyme [Mycena sanguinolenta]|nr:3-carboxy-cis cis-mucoante lactonizing enzyme [Mycena sanguinolenta]
MLPKILQALCFGLAVVQAQNSHGSSKHHILVGDFGTLYNQTLMLPGTQDVGKGFLYTLVVDAETKSLTLTHTTPAAAAHPWLSINRPANVVYGSGWSPPIDGRRTFSSYKIEPDFSVSLINTVISCGTKPIANDFIAEAGEHGVFYSVDFFTPCGEVWTVDERGALRTKIQSLGFSNVSTLHGFSTTPDLKYMYITDLGANMIHSFSLDLDNGLVTLQGNFTPSELGAGPRHSAITSNGAYIYVLDEEGLRVDQFTVTPATGALHYTNTSLAATPFGLSPANATLYWSDEVAISSDGVTLYASTRSKVEGFTGFMSAWSLANDGSISDTLFTVPTPANGGTSNIISVSPWSDASKNMLILTDEDTDFVALYELQGRELVLLDLVNITGTHCCSGSVWLD